MELTYLLNSGFMVRDENVVLVFDDYEDPAGIVDAVYDKGDFDRLYVLATHAHFDHFGTHIRAYAPKVSQYIFGSDIKHTKRVKIFPTKKITYMKRYTQWEDDVIKIWSFDSTDVGVSFMVEFPSGKQVYHAGDFNWWYWEDDTLENQELSEKIFRRQLKRLSNLEADVAFFPVDERLEAAKEKGAIEFIAKTKVKSFVAMHRADCPQWTPSPRFLSISKDLPIWAPVKPGEQRIFDDGHFLEA